jgi:hypothetical protein
MLVINTNQIIRYSILGISILFFVSWLSWIFIFSIKTRNESAHQNEIKQITIPQLEFCKQFEEIFPNGKIGIIPNLKNKWKPQIVGWVIVDDKYEIKFHLNISIDHKYNFKKLEEFYMALLVFDSVNVIEEQKIIKYVVDAKRTITLHDWNRIYENKGGIHALLAIPPDVEKIESNAKLLNLPASQ